MTILFRRFSHLARVSGMVSGLAACSQSSLAQRATAPVSPSPPPRVAPQVRPRAATPTAPSNSVAPSTPVAPPSNDQSSARPSPPGGNTPDTPTDPPTVVVIPAPGNPNNAPAIDGATTDENAPNGNEANGGAPNGNAPAAPNGAAAPKAAPVLPARGTYRVEGDAEELSVFAVSVDAPELLTAIAAKAGLKLLVDDKVSRKLTVNIVHKPARRVIEDIASAYGLSSADVEGVIMLSEGIPTSPSSYLLSDIDSIPTKYVDAANARNLLPVFLQDYVKVNSEQNAVVLSAPREVLLKFRDDIARFDTPASQILVDLLVVELTDTTADQLGLNFAYGNAGNGIGSDAGTGGLVFRTVSTLPASFTANLRALQSKGRARVRANPRIATVSGRRASIFVGRQRYIVTPIDNGRGQQNNFIDAGVRLGMTPFTGGQGQILVDVDAEVSTLSAPDPITRLPEKSTRTASTTVRVGDGQTIVIGGLKQQESRTVRTRIPLLSSLPFIGGLFRTRDIRETTSDLLIFITPRTLSDTGHLPADEEKTLKQQFLDSDLKAALPPIKAAPDELAPALRNSAPSNRAPVVPR